MSLLPGNKVAPEMASIGIRVPHGDDFATMARLHQQSFINGWNTEAVKNLVESQGAFALVASDKSGTVFGFVVGRVAAREGEILTIVVNPSNRSQGMATRLLMHAIECFSENGAATVFLEVAETNETAINLYLGQGFTQIGIRPKYAMLADGERCDALLMRRLLEQGESR